VIPTIISQALAGKKEIQLGSLTPKRDLTFVKDTVKGFLLAAENKNAVGQTFNIGAQKTISIGELADKIIELTGKDCRIVEDKARIRPDASEVMVLIADAGKARQELGWIPDTDLDKGLQATIDYIGSYLKKFKTDIYNI